MIKRFINQYSTSRAFGFPMLWSARTAWAWRKGPNQRLVIARENYVNALQGLRAEDTTKQKGRLRDGYLSKV